MFALLRLQGALCVPDYASGMRRQYDELITGLATDSTGYAQAVADAITKSGKDFRHFASGDFQSTAHVALVCDIAKRSPRVKHWAATRETSYVQAYLASGGTIPTNLVIRISADVIDRPAKDIGLPTSTVVTSGATCDANKRGGECGPCRKCWSRRVQNVAYPLH